MVNDDNFDEKNMMMMKDDDARHIYVYVTFNVALGRRI